MITGHSAGVAAAQATSSGRGVQAADIVTLQKRLMDQRQVLHRE